MVSRSKLLKRKIRQTGKTTVSIDKRYKAKKVGWRVSETGNLYFENRKNRSDKDRRKRL